MQPRCRAPTRPRPRRRPRAAAGWASPAGEAVPRLPPTPPRLRICGEATVCEASARPGSSARRFSMIRVYGTEAPSRTLLLADLPLVQLADAVQVQQVLGPAVVEVDLDHHVGAARDGHSGGVLGLRGERLLPAGGAKEVHDGSLLRLVVVRFEPDRVRRARLVHVLFTRCGLSTQRVPRPGAVTETMKELAGSPPRSCRFVRTARLSNLTVFAAFDNRGRTAHSATTRQNGGDDDAAARTAGHRRAGPAAARRRGRAGPHACAA